MNKNNASTGNRRMVPLRYVLGPIVIILVSIAILAVVSALAPKPEKHSVVIKAPLVDVADIKRQDITFRVDSQGSVMPRTETTLISEVSGMITKVSDKFKVGGFFAKGEQLLVIDDITYQVAVIQAQSRLDAAKASLLEEKARTKQAENEWKLSGKDLSEAPVLAIRIPQQQKAEADLLAAKADLKAAKIKLERTKIIAPYNALVKSKSVDIGQFVSTGTQLGQTFAIDYAEIRLPIKQRDVNFLNLPRVNEHNTKGSPVTLSYNLLGERHQWPSHLTRSEGVVDSASRVHYVIAQIDDPYALKQGAEHEAIHIGTFVNAQISGKVLNDLVAIPRRSIYGANTIYTVDSDNRLHIHQLELLRTDANFAYTLEVFLPDHRLVQTKLETPVEGMKLRINGEEESVATDESTPKKEAQGES